MTHVEKGKSSLEGKGKLHGGMKSSKENYRMIEMKRDKRRDREIERQRERHRSHND